MGRMTALIAALEALTGPVKARSSQWMAVIRLADQAGLSDDELDALGRSLEGSLDAALTLVPEGTVWHVMHDYDLLGRAKIGPAGVSIYRVKDHALFIRSAGATPAIAFCIAALKARE